MTTATANRTRVLGTDISSATSVEEALEMSGLNWGLKVLNAENMTVTTEDGVISTSIPGQRLVMRDDTFVTMGAVGGRYTAIDNRQVFDLSKHIIGQGGRFSEAGEIDHGRKTYMRLDIPDSNIELSNGKDLINFGVVIKASHDGSGNVSAALEGTRLVCTNGMVAKIKGLEHTFKVRHTANAAHRMHEAEVILKGAAQYSKSFVAAASHMLDTKMDRTQFGEFIDSLFPRPEGDQGRGITMWENRRDSLMHLFNFAETNNLCRETEWGAYNAVSEYLDWGSQVRTHNGLSESETRAIRHLEATTQSVKNDAFSMLVGA